MVWLKTSFKDKGKQNCFRRNGKTVKGSANGGQESKARWIYEWKGIREVLQYQDLTEGFGRGNCIVGIAR